MTRNFLVFIFALFLLLVFSFAFCYVSIYSEVLIAGIFALIGFVVTFVIAIVIGLASKEEGGSLYIWFFGIGITTGVILVWYISRAGTLLKIW
jgi:hypothetical protein